MNTEHEFVQSPHRAQWPFPEEQDQRKPEPLSYEPAWYLDAQAASAVTDDEPTHDNGPEMLGALLLVGAAVAVGVVGYFAFLY